MQLSEMLSKKISVTVDGDRFMWVTGSYTIPSWGLAGTESQALNDAFAAIIRSAMRKAASVERHIAWLESRVSELELSIGEDVPPASCPICGGRRNDVIRERRNTAYVDDELNFIFACGRCRDEDDKHWEEQWAEYHASRF